MPEPQTWFEAKLDVPLAIMLNKIAAAYDHRGKTARAAFLERLNAAIPAPEAPDRPAGP